MLSSLYLRTVFLVFTKMKTLEVALFELKLKAAEVRTIHSDFSIVFSSVFSLPG